MSNILYLKEHISCSHYASDHYCNFTHRKVERGVSLDFDPQCHYLVFLFDGEVVVDCNEFTNRRFVKGDIFFIAKSSKVNGFVTADSHLIECMSDSVNSVCDKFNLVSYWPSCQEIQYDFKPVQIVSQFEVFLHQLAYYLDQGVKCEHYYNLKHQEMFLMFRWFYSKEAVATLFYPIIGPSLDFRSFILANYMKVGNAGELARMAAMSRSGFDAAFKKEFGIPVGQWMLQQKAKHIKFDMLAPEVTLGDIILKYDFNSPTHFTRFCKQQFGCTPSEMMARQKKQKSMCPGA